MRLGLSFIVVLLLMGCSDEEAKAPQQAKTPMVAENVFESTKTTESTAKEVVEIDLTAMGVLPVNVPVPADNPMTEAKVELGKKLYFDPALSRSGQFSCNSCHNLGTYGVDNQVTSIGHKWQRGGRNAPTVFNAAFWSQQFWDGRAPLLEDQAKGPPLNPIEMAAESDQAVLARLHEAGYESLFTEVFGENTLTYDNMAKAIAAFERTLITPNAPFDKFVRGEAELSAAAKAGMAKVKDIGCVSCHSGPLFTSNGFENFAYGSDAGLKSVTGKDEDDHVFRVQSWRNVAMTAPYFHDGSVATLGEAVRIMAKIQLDQELNDQDISDIVAFLESLTGESPKVDFPILPRPAGKALIWRD